jgi:hypothetical protein
VHGRGEVDGDAVVLAELGEHLVRPELVGREGAQADGDGDVRMVAEHAAEGHLHRAGDLEDGGALLLRGERAAAEIRDYVPDRS